MSQQSRTAALDEEMGLGDTQTIGEGMADDH
jgi:hypothetical protein